MVDTIDKKPNFKEQVQKFAEVVITDYRSVCASLLVFAGSLLWAKGVDVYVWNRCQAENPGGFRGSFVRGDLRHSINSQLDSLRRYRDEQDLTRVGLEMVIAEDQRVSAARWECRNAVYHNEIGDSPSLDLNQSNARLLAGLLSLTELGAATMIAFRRDENEDGRVCILDNLQA